MSKLIRALWLGCIVLPLLSGCLQVELYGPVADSTVTISALRDNTEIAVLRTENEAETEARYDAELWQKLDNFLRLVLAGAVEIPEELLEDDQLYLVTAQDGRDLDYDGNKLLDEPGVELLGKWHAIMTGAQLKLRVVRVNILTEAIYQSLIPQLEELSDAEVIAELDSLANVVVRDLNRDGDTNYIDVLNWSYIANADGYNGAEALLDRLAFAIDYDLDAEILEINGQDIILKAGWAPVVTNSGHADKLIGCLQPILLRDLCTFGDLPLIGQEYPSPTTAEIMSRVVVSHPWMAARFEQLLELYPPDMLLLMRSLSAISIDANTRPSYYDPNSAAIHLDADSFWVTQAERETISTEPDFRGEFAKEVDFADLWRYTKDSDYVDSGGADSNGNRPIEDVINLSAALFFHELAHASDFFPTSSFGTLPADGTAAETIFEIPSDRLQASLPLQSPELVGIADVLFFGTPADAAQAAYTPEQIGAWFDPDRANDLYAYSDQFEDLAMLFEEFMMHLHYGFERDVAFTTVPDEGDNDTDCSDYRVGWGVRGRIGSSQLQSRLEAVLSELLPERDYTTEVALLPLPRSMNTNLDWCQNIDFGVSAQARVQSLKLGSKTVRAANLKPRPYR